MVMNLAANELLINAVMKKGMMPLGNHIILYYYTLDSKYSYTFFFKVPLDTYPVSTGTWKTHAGKDKLTIEKVTIVDLLCRTFVWSAPHY